MERQSYLVGRVSTGPSSHLATPSSAAGHHPGSSCVPGVLSSARGCQRGGAGHGDGFLRPPRSDISADTERSG